jgi:hypothetical protein
MTVGLFFFGSNRWKCQTELVFPAEKRQIIHFGKYAMYRMPFGENEFVTNPLLVKNDTSI